MIHIILLAVPEEERMGIKEEPVKVGIRQVFLTSTTWPLGSEF